jgi:toxin ParE1/3/4
MKRDVIVHEEASAELGSIYDYIADRAGPSVAWRFVQGVKDLLAGLEDFPERGSIQHGLIPGLRVIGYRKRMSIAFAVWPERVLVLGFFYAGRNLDEIELLKRGSSAGL